MSLNRKSIYSVSISIILILVVAMYLFIPDSGIFTPQKPRIRSASSPKAGIESKAARVDYFHRLLRDPATDQIPPGMRQSELAYAQKMKESLNLLKKPAGNGFAWEFAGPEDVGGRTRALAVDVTSADTLLAGGVSGGIWKSTDRGQTWILKNTPIQPLSVTSLAQDPREGQTGTWYYATGEFIGNSASDRSYAASFFGTGIYKSSGGGELWELLEATTDPGPNQWNWAFDYVSKIVINPNTGTIFTANNGFGIFRSTDDGTSFELVLGNAGGYRYVDVVVTSTGTVIATISENDAGGTQPVTPGIYKSTSDGASGSWTDITPTALQSPNLHDRTVLAEAPSNPDVVYALTVWTDWDNDFAETFYFHKITISSGAAINRSANLPEYTNRGALNAQGGYNMVLGVKPDDENFVLLGLTNLYRSRDGFNTKPGSGNRDDVWIGGYHYNDAYFQYPDNHPDHHVFAFDPDYPDKMWNGNDGGIYYVEDVTVSLGSGELLPWQDKNGGFNVTQFYTASISDDAGDNRIMGGTQDNGSPYFTYDGNTTSSSSDVSSGDGAYGYFGDSYAYTSSQLGRVLRLGYSGDAPSWGDWSEIQPTDASGQLFINPFRVDPNNQNVMYYPAGYEIYRNNQLSSLPNFLPDGTMQGWTNIASWAVSVSSTISTLAISQQGPHVFYYAESRILSPKIYRVHNAATSTASPAETILSAAPVGSYVHDIAINPDDAAEILVVLSNYNIVSLYHSADSGKTFTDVEGDLSGEERTSGTYTYWTGPSIRSATILPVSNGTVYLVGTSTGIYSTMTLNGSNTVWDPESPDMVGNSVVEYIDSRKSDGTVVVGTHGRGIFIGEFDASLSVDNKDVAQPESFQLAQNFPNPFNPSTTIEFVLPTAQHVVLRVFDIRGREVAVLLNQQRSAGKHSLIYDATNLASGIYLYTISAGEYNASRKMMILK